MQVGTVRARRQVSRLDLRGRRLGHAAASAPFILVPDDGLAGAGLVGHCFSFSGLPRPSPASLSQPCRWAPAATYRRSTCADGGGQHRAECPWVAVSGGGAAERSP